jgi:hypothetical protein
VGVGRKFWRVVDSRRSAMTRFRTDAWLLRGISSIPGDLVLNNATLTYTAFGTGSAWPQQLRTLERNVGRQGIATAIDAGERTVVFEWPISELRYWVPWYYFGGGMKLSRGDATLRFSFGRPAHSGASAISHEAGLLQAAANLNEIHTMRRHGAAWMEVLSRAAAEMRSSR